MKKLSPEQQIERERILSQYAGEDKVISFEDMNKILAENKTPTLVAKSSFPRLEKLVDGFEGGEVIVISGPTKAGKSLLAQTLTYDFHSQGIPTLWFSYELTPRQFLARFPKDWMPHAFLPEKMKSNTMDWINDRVLEGKVKYGIKVVMIDHLHFIVDMEKLRNPSLEIGAVMRGLKTMAIGHNIIVFLLCHIGKIEVGKRPTYNDSRDSSFIAQECDTFLMVWRLKDNKSQGIINQARLSVELCRRTGTLAKSFKIVKSGGLLHELDSQQEDEDDET